MADGYNGPINTDPADGEARIIIYGYRPSLALAVIGAVTFALLLALHIFHILRCKLRQIKIHQGLIIFGCAMECVGYAMRAWSWKRPFLVIAFVIQYFLIVVAPVFFSAALYFGLSILLSQTAREDLLPIRGKTLIIIFVLFDTVTTIMQIAGAALIGTSESNRVGGDFSGITPDQANDILISGLAVQTASFLVFLFFLSYVIFRFRQSRHNSVVQATKSEEGNIIRPALSMQALLILLVAAILIFTRTVFRLAESAEGLFGYASTHEALFGVFEYTPVIVAIGILAVRPLQHITQD